MQLLNGSPQRRADCASAAQFCPSTGAVGQRGQPARHPTPASRAAPSETLPSTTEPSRAEPQRSPNPSLAQPPRAQLAESSARPALQRTARAGTGMPSFKAPRPHSGVEQTQIITHHNKQTHKTTTQENQSYISKGI